MRLMPYLAALVHGYEWKEVYQHKDKWYIRNNFHFEQWTHTVRPYDPRTESEEARLSYQDWGFTVDEFPYYSPAEIQELYLDPLWVSELIPERVLSGIKAYKSDIVVKESRKMHTL